MRGRIVLVVFFAALLLSCTDREQRSVPEQEYKTRPGEVAIHFDHGVIVTGIPNFFRIVAHQDKPLTITEVSAILNPAMQKKPYDVQITENSGRFIFQVNDPGTIVFTINTEFGPIKIERVVKTLPVRIYLSRYGSGSSNSIGVEEFKQQTKIDAVVACCNIEGRCPIERFELVRAPKAGQVEKITNEGGAFSEEAIRLIEACQPGDLYVFRMIAYRSPGEDYPRYANDLTVEIKQ